MESAMEIFEELATGASCCELSFKPDESAIGFVEGVVNAEVGMRNAELAKRMEHRAQGVRHKKRTAEP
jgi:hypothetical protein